MESKAWAVVVAAGMSSRMGGTVKKQFMRLRGKEVLVYSLSTFESMASIEGVVVATGEEDIPLVQDLCERYHLSKVRSVVPGGDTRQKSVYEGLKGVKDCLEVKNRLAVEDNPADVVLIHDGARPFATAGEIEETIRAARTYGGALLAAPVTDTIKVVSEDLLVTDTPLRSTLYAAQTPQTFRFPDILEAHKRALIAGDEALTDDAQIAERYSDLEVKIVPGSYDNIKITTKRDIELGLKILESRVLRSI